MPEPDGLRPQRLPEAEWSRFWGLRFRARERLARSLVIECLAAPARGLLIRENLPFEPVLVRKAEADGAVMLRVKAEANLVAVAAALADGLAHLQRQRETALAVCGAYTMP